MSTDRPIACKLAPSELASRQEETARIARDSLLSREARAHGVRLTFRAGAATEREVRRLVAAESECCPFLEFELAQVGSALRLDVTGPAEAEPIISALFADGRRP